VSDFQNLMKFAFSTVTKFYPKILKDQGIYWFFQKKQKEKKKILLPCGHGTFMYVNKKFKTEVSLNWQSVFGNSKFHDIFTWEVYNLSVVIFCPCKS
jgi:hypothetical protein